MYPAKILLFGEYTIMNGSMAMSVPYDTYSGTLEFLEAANTDIVSNQMLRDYFQYLNEIADNVPFNIDLERFGKEIDEGLFFKSTIPKGYGLGSSGALVAAVYERYVKNRYIRRCGNVELQLQMRHLAMLESFFHGNSSGIDPLVSYTRWPILTRADKTLARLRGDRMHHPSVGLFLIDTDQIGNTRENVAKYKHNLQNNNTLETIEKQVVPVVNLCITTFLDKMDDFFAQVSVLSQFQLHYFSDMIPTPFAEHFQHGLNTGHFSLKLCGSGGGGFVLGFSPQENIAEAINYFNSKGLRTISL